VAPGFIDLHEHGQEPRNYQFQAHDGVTTSLELELGTDDVQKCYEVRQGKPLINFGVSAGHIPMRIHVMTGQAVPSLSAMNTPMAEAANHRELTAEELARVRAAVERGLQEGALAEGMGINYTPGASHWEILEMFRLAAKYHAPLQPRASEPRFEQSFRVEMTNRCGNTIPSAFALTVRCHPREGCDHRAH
jgi:hypothetical protein